MTDSSYKVVIREVKDGITIGEAVSPSVPSAGLRVYHCLSSMSVAVNKAIDSIAEIVSDYEKMGRRPLGDEFRVVVIFDIVDNEGCHSRYDMTAARWYVADADTEEDR